MKTFLVLAQSSHYGQNVDLVILSKEGDHTHIARVSEEHGALNWVYATDTQAEALYNGAWGGVVAPTITLPRAIAEMVRERL